MAHDPTRSWPTGKGPGDTSIPGAAWLELLNGQAFPVVGAGAMVWNGNVWVPVSTQNRLPVDATVSGTVDVSNRADRQLGQVTLSGQKVEPVFPREIRNGSTNVRTVIAPHWASGAIVFCHIYGVTGAFGENQGLNLRVRNGLGPLDIYTSLRISDTTTPRKRAPGTLMVVIHPTQRDIDPPSSGGPDVIRVIAPLGERLGISLSINGEFGVGEGFDCACSVFWMTA